MSKAWKKREQPPTKRTKRFGAKQWFRDGQFHTAIPTLNFVIIGPGKPNGCRNSVVRDCDGVNINESLLSTFVKDLLGKNEAFGLRRNSQEHISHRSFPK